jgi:hypothetical protein
MVVLSPWWTQVQEATTMTKTILGGLMALLLASAALVPQAQARCWWNGFAYHCVPTARYWHYRYYRPYAYYHHQYHHYYYRGYAYRY